MSQVTIKELNDLKKLEGFRIEDVKVTMGPDAALLLRLSHPVAERQVMFKVVSGIKFGRTGNVMISNSTLTFGTEDVEAPV